MIDNIVYFILACIVQLSVSTGFKLITDHDQKIYYKYYLLILPFSAIMTLEYHCQLTQLNALSSIIFYFILYYFIYRKEMFDTIFYGAAISVIGMMIDIFIMVLSTAGSFIFTSCSITTIRFIDTLVVESILLLTLNSSIIKKWLKKLNKNMRNIKFPYLSFLLIMIVLMSLGLSFYELIQKHGLNSLSITNYILFLSSVIFIWAFLRRMYYNYELKKTNDYLIKNNEFYLTLINDYRILKHNIIHQLNGIKSIANKKSNELINELILEYNSNTKTIQNLKKMPMGISGVVYEKIYSFDDNELGVEIDNYITTDIFNNLIPKNYNLLCETLGILLDNALEATEKTKEKILMIDMRETSKFYKFKIINTFENFIDIEKIGSIKYTTKKNGNGIGLFSLINRKKVKIKTSIINNLFISEFSIEKK